MARIFVIDCKGCESGILTKLILKRLREDTVITFYDLSAMLDAAISNPPELFIVCHSFVYDGDTPLREIEAAQRIHAAHASIPLIVQTVRSDVIVEAWQAGAAGFAVAPIIPSELALLRDAILRGEQQVVLT